MAKRIDVRKLRKRLDYTQVELAEELGVSQATVCKLENGFVPSKPVAKLLLQLSEKHTAAAPRLE